MRGRKYDVQYGTVVVFVGSESVVSASLRLRGCVQFDLSFRPRCCLYDYCTQMLFIITTIDHFF